MGKQPALTPYDRGDRLEPHPWVRGPIAHPTTGLPRVVNSDDYGRVDFDDDEGATVLTAYVERSGDGYTLHLENVGAPLTVNAPAAVLHTR
ncbi:hypothetical protein SPF06_18530 [Sinomonas sp. JGH33]|uniref:Uncharacterized protein n=1 Tax=Sinomonas terricola TaxID=3110330 RepID=A0ABU5TAM3_9MICC|nr:hypothetical protein [Sinomonas sp. JGH33]MEA5456724.1 hypothetical protein [Sinomonas sp. JGH33]